MQISYHELGFRMKSCPLVSIIILNYNGLEHLEACLSSIFKTMYPKYEVIFVDNGSTDGSVDFVKSNYPSARVIQNKRNDGSSKGYNLGVMNAKGKYVATLNNDIEVHPNWLLPLISFMEKHPEVAGVDPKYVNYFDRLKFDKSSAAGRYIDFLANPITRGALEEDRGQYNNFCRVFYTQSIFRLDAILDVGLFDEDFFFGYEDTDLGWRLNLRGYHLMYIPTSIIYHKGGQSKFQNPGDANSKSKLKPGFYFLNKRNKLLTLIKNYSLSTLLRLLPLILFEHISYVVYWAAKGEKQYSVESLQALLWIVKNFKRVWAKHVQVQRLRKRKDYEIMALMKPYSGDPVKLFRLWLTK